MTIGLQKICLSLSEYKLNVKMLKIWFKLKCVKDWTASFCAYYPTTTQLFVGDLTFWTFWTRLGWNIPPEIETSFIEALLK